MKTVWKQPLEVRAQQTIELTLPATGLHVGLNTDKMPCLWFVADTGTEKVKPRKVMRVIKMTGTGEEIPHNTKHLGSVVMASGTKHFWT